MAVYLATVRCKPLLKLSVVACRSYKQGKHWLRQVSILPQRSKKYTVPGDLSTATHFSQLLETTHHAKSNILAALAESE